MTQVEVIPYQTSWPVEYVVHVEQLRPKIQDQVARIDHVGSTSIPGMVAKDIIDIQIAVPEFSQTFIETMTGQGYQYHPHLKDNPRAGTDPALWQKQVFTEPAGTRRLNIHVRRLGAPNMVQNLLFRDYLRAHPTSIVEYGRLKQRLAEKHPEDRDFYYSIKDPLFEIIWEAAVYWAENTGWRYDDEGQS
jgi:GrpB-like predicted nucleotidyltransferase (UPF0157 family)